MIETKGVHKSFGEHHVLRGVDLSVPRGKTLVVLGLSGSGKSVLMKHLIGLVQPDRGHIYIDGEDIAAMPAEGLLRVRRKFGMVFQQAALFDSMSVGDNVAFPLRAHTSLRPAEIRGRVEDKLAALGLQDAYDEFPSALSGGMRKRVGLARALILDASIILYDEPTTGLDPVTTETVDTMILDAGARYKVTQVVITHDVGSALHVGDSVAVIDQGVIVATCPAAELAEHEHPFVRRFLGAWRGKQR